MVSVVAASRLVLAGESCLQAGQFVFEFLHTWLLIQRGPAPRQTHVQCSWQMLAALWKSSLGRSEGEFLAGKNMECAESDEDCENTVVDFEAALDWPSRRSFSDVRVTGSQA